jgi:hypothetical protein
MCNRINRNKVMYDPALGLSREEVVLLAREEITKIRAQKQVQLDGFC